jgi:hypothetical protein
MVQARLARPLSPSNSLVMKSRSLDHLVCPGHERGPERLERRAGRRVPRHQYPDARHLPVSWPSTLRGTARSPASRNRRRFIGITIAMGR